MKKISLSFVLLLFCTYNIYGQAIEINPTSTSFEGRVVPSYAVLLHNIKQRKALVEWQKHLKTYGGKPRFKKGELKCTLLVNSITQDTLMVYSKVKQGKSGHTMLTTAFSVDGRFVDAQELHSESKAIEKWLYEFALEARRQSADKEIARAEKRLGRYLSETANLENRKEFLIRNIETNRAKLLENSQWMQSSAIDRTNINNEIELQNSLLREAEKDSDKKRAQRRLDRLIKERSALDNKKDKADKEDIKLNGLIGKSERELIRLDRELMAQHDNLEKQKKLLEKLKEDRNNIR